MNNIFSKELSIHNQLIEKISLLNQDERIILTDYVLKLNSQYNQEPAELAHQKEC